MIQCFVYPGITGNIIIVNKDSPSWKSDCLTIYFDRWQTIWNPSEFTTIAKLLLPSKKADRFGDIIEYGGIKIDYGGCYNLDEPTNEQIFVFMCYSNFIDYQGNYICADNLFWSADNKIYQVGLIRHDDKLIREKGPLIKECTGFMFWNHGICCYVSVVIDGKITNLRQPCRKLIYINQKFYSPAWNIDCETSQTGIIFPDYTLILDINSHAKKVKDITYFQGRNSILSYDDNKYCGKNAQIICSPDDPNNVYLADTTDGRQICALVRHTSIANMFAYYEQ